MDMASVHNRDARPGAARDNPIPDLARASEQPGNPPSRGGYPDPASDPARVHLMTKQLADEFAPSGNGYRYEVKRPGSVEIVLFSLVDGSVVRRIPLEGESAPPPPRFTREFRA